MRQHFASLDALRGVAAIMIVIYHRRWWVAEPPALSSAYLAVDFFFCLSGFVVAHAYGARLGGTLSFRKYAVLRLIRLWPMLLAGTLLGIAVVLGSQHLQSLIAADLKLSILLALLVVPNPWAGASLFPVNGPVWSLFFELVANAVYGLIARPLDDWRTLGAMATTMFAWLVMATPAEGVQMLGITGATFWAGFPRVGVSFLAGVGIEALHRSGRIRLPRLRFVVLAGVLIVALLGPGRTVIGGRAYDLLCVSIVFPLIVAFGVRTIEGKARRVCLWLGALSYPVYAIHAPLLDLVEHCISRAAPGASGGFKLVVALAVVAVASWLALTAYDAPVRRVLTRAMTGGAPARDSHGSEGDGHARARGL